ncbi:hypothetical protein N0B51_13865 [Tsuneonella sp. YG55]|uniref:Uncharacterized protein n=1 Tax=Tsuneonella litorea TaxID=2976475 RepID=A0A9X2W4G5_9SPHN|nr:hypothetical protein [Tsuneonella litorea]MCT2560064.1 hypothetical protein [Tsuneonella litorea]
MTKVMKASAVAAVLCSLAAPSIVASQEDGGAQERDFVGPYLQQKQSELAAQDGLLNASGKANIAKGIYSVLIARDPLANKDIEGGARKDEVRSALLRTLANYLASVGKTPADLNQALRSGISPVEAAANVLFYRPDTQQEFWASEVVVVGRLKSVSPIQGVKGIGSAANFEVVESLKGGYSAGDTIQLMQASGTDVAIAGELTEGSAGDYLLLVSPTRYAAFTGTRPSPKATRVLAQFSPYRITDGTLVATGYSAASNGKSLADYREQIN